MTRVVRRARQNNTLSIFLILIFTWLIGSNLFPTYVARFVPGFYAAQNCAWVRTSQDRANHQSLVGRGTQNPISLEVATTPINSTDASGSLFVRITVINNTLGTVPFIYDPNNVIVNDNGSSGLGVSFIPANALTAGLGRVDPTIFPDNQIKLLGPRQRCIHTLEFPNGNVLSQTNIGTGTAQVRAFYRSTSAGAITPPVQPLYGGLVPTPIFPDAGLWVGIVESPAVIIPLAPSA